jgi:hypothetical protein
MARMRSGILRFAPAAGLLVLFAFPSPVAALANGWWGLPPLFALFLCFAAALLGWGSLVERWLGGGWAGAFLYSSALGVAFMLGAGALGVLPLRPLFFLVLLPGGWLLARRPGEAGVSRWVWAVFLFAAGVRALSAFLPQAHGDPLLYHLTGPRLWQLAGASRLAPDMPNAILAATWEYLYLWPQVFWADVTNVNHLLAAQIFCQWTHLLWGWLGAALVIERLTRGDDSGPWRFLFPLAALFLASVQWTAGLAKNDAGVAFWCLGSWWLLERACAERKLRLFAAAGVLAGFAVTGKISAVLFLAPALLVSLGLFLGRARAKAVAGAGAFSGAFLAGLLPVYLRNWHETGNPFFPMFTRYFPSPWISASWAAHFSAVHPGEETHRWHILLVRLGELGRESPLVFGWALLPLALAVPAVRRRLAGKSHWFLVSGLSFALFAACFSLDAEIRYLGATLILLAASGLAVLLAVAEALPGKGRAAGGWVLLVGILAASKLPTHLLWKFPKIAPGGAFLLTHTGGDSKAWLREHAAPGALIVFLNDNESYYLLGHRITMLTERPDLDAPTREEKSLAPFVRAICHFGGATYLLESRSQTGLAVRFPSPALEPAVAFQGVSSRVYDLRILERELFPGAPPECGRIPAPAYSPSTK